MFRRAMIALMLAASLLATVACSHKKANNPLAHINSKQPDKILYDRAMDAMKQRKYDVARITLQTLINTYPDSEFVARAKLTVGESWYEEGSSASLAQAETEFRDFITFFPNMPEAAEAQLKIADIHYRQMEKPDRDYTHARRAEDEYRQLLLQYPDSKLADTARVRLLQVQEVLAERQFRIAKFYFARGSLLAAIARARTLTDTYPLYSQADEALYILGQSYEQESDRVRAVKLPDDVKKRLGKEYADEAAAAYTKIVTRYPAMPRYQDARKRLAAMDRPVPAPAPEMVEQNKKEINSRMAQTHYERFVTDMGKRPNLSSATRVGQPTLVDPKETDAPTLVREIDKVAREGAPGGPNTVKAEAVSSGGKVPENQPAPRSNTADVPSQAPSQLNEAEMQSSSSSSSTAATEQKAGDSTSTATKEDKNSSSSQKKKKKHHFKLPIPL
ncbi:MAG: outer membrane protein assembly factor BamD [Acidobacteriota bacterium]|nr:outer membrane protein assembly factor BamD [Acidobacteriota bacterium]